MPLTVAPQLQIALNFEPRSDLIRPIRPIRPIPSPLPQRNGATQASGVPKVVPLKAGLPSPAAGLYLDVRGSVALSSLADGAAERLAIHAAGGSGGRG